MACVDVLSDDEPMEPASSATAEPPPAIGSAETITASEALPAPAPAAAESAGLALVEDILSDDEPMAVAPVAAAEAPPATVPAVTAPSSGAPAAVAHAAAFEDILSDDEPMAVAPVATAEPPPATAPAATAPAREVLATEAPAAAMDSTGPGSVDILSDDEEENAVLAPHTQAPSQPPPAAEIAALPPARGIRSAVVAEVTSADSEDLAPVAVAPVSTGKGGKAKGKGTGKGKGRGKGREEVKEKKEDSHDEEQALVEKSSSAGLDQEEADTQPQSGKPSSKSSEQDACNRENSVHDAPPSHAAWSAVRKCLTNGVEIAFVLFQGKEPGSEKVRVQVTSNATGGSYEEAKRICRLCYVKLLEGASKKEVDAFKKSMCEASKEKPAAATVPTESEPAAVAPTEVAAPAPTESEPAAVGPTEAASAGPSAAAAKNSRKAHELTEVGDDSSSQPPAKKAKESDPVPDATTKKGNMCKDAKDVKDVKDVKEKKLTKDEMESRVLEYMQQQNRPYNAQNVFDNLHGAVPKGQVQVLLDALALSGKLAVKEYGKAKAYLPAQVGTSEAVEEEAKALQCDVDAIKAKVDASKAALEESRHALSGFRNRRSAAAEAQVAGCEVPQLEEKLSTLRAAAEEAGENKKEANVDEAEISRVEAESQQAHSEWRRRKRLCMEMLFRFSEMSGQTVPQLTENYGVDTDEACNQTFPEAFAR